MDCRAAFTALALCLLGGCTVHSHPQAAQPPPPPPPPHSHVHGGDASRVPAAPSRTGQRHRAAQPSRGDRATDRGDRRGDGRRRADRDERVYREDVSEERWRRLSRYDKNHDDVLDAAELRRAREDRRDRKHSRARRRDRRGD